ncbi:MAG: DUF805 domain-containing protein [Paracoccaceae bacterium]|nr:DUF805 domain-containing protein [Paracoccaceae bacterium]
MSFMGAVQSAFANFFTLSGRASRSEYWYFFLFCFVGSFLLGLVDGIVFGTSMNGLAPISTIFSLLVVIPGIALGFRRLHDIDKSGWWLLLNFVPVIGWLVLIYFLVKKGTEGANSYGLDPLGGGATAGFGATPAE